MEPAINAATCGWERRRAPIGVLDSASYDQATRADAPRQAPPVRVVPLEVGTAQAWEGRRDTLHGTLQLMVLIRCGGHI